MRTSRSFEEIECATLHRLPARAAHPPIIANHLVAAFLGDWVVANVSADVMRWILGSAFVGFAGWALVPDKLQNGHAKPNQHGLSVATLVAFFLAEMGDKTQFASLALGAKYASLAMVVPGTTLGMMAANIPAVLVAECLAEYALLTKIRVIAAALFAILGILILLKVNPGFGLT